MSHISRATFAVDWCHPGAEGTHEWRLALLRGGEGHQDPNKPLYVELRECFVREQHKLVDEDLCAQLAEWEAKR